MFIHNSPPETSTCGWVPVYTCISGILIDSMLITTPSWACAWPWREWPWPLAATVSCERGPICQICFIVAAISEADFGCSTAIGWRWYLLPKSRAAWLTSSKLRCPSRGSVLKEEGMLGMQKLSPMVIQLRNKIMKPLINKLLRSLERPSFGNVIFMLAAKGRRNRRRRGDGGWRSSKGWARI